MPNKDNKILKYNHREKSLKTPFMIYADLECQLEKMDSCPNNLEKSYTEKKTKHTLMQQKINLIVTETKIVWKSFVKT